MIQNDVPSKNRAASDETKASSSARRLKWFFLSLVFVFQFTAQACVGGYVVRPDGTPVANTTVLLIFQTYYGWPGYMVTLTTDAYGGYLYNWYADPSAPSIPEVVNSVSDDGVVVYVQPNGTQVGPVCEVSDSAVVKHIPSWQLNAGGTQYFTVVPDIVVSGRSVTTTNCDPYAHPGVDTDGDGLFDDVEPVFGTSVTEKDTDGDGLTDYAEVYGIKYDGAYPFGLPGTDIRSRGASPLHKDLFIEIDYYHKSDSNGTVSMYPSADLRNQIAAFYGFLPIASNPDGDSGINAVVVPGQPLDLDGLVCADEYKKASYRSSRREGVFTHGLYCNRFTAAKRDGTIGTKGGGKGVVGGSLFAVSASPPNNDVSDDMTEKRVHNLYAVTLHELGHNLGLRHGGDEVMNCKPNYPSLLNYAYDYSFNVPSDDDVLATTQLQYSDGQLPEVDEEALVEVNPLDRTMAQVSFLKYFGGSEARGFPLSLSGGRANVDWNRNLDTETAAYEMNVRSMGYNGASCTNSANETERLEDHDDMAEIATSLSDRKSANESDLLPSEWEDSAPIPEDDVDPLKVFHPNSVLDEWLVEAKNVTGYSASKLRRFFANSDLPEAFVRKLLTAAAQSGLGGRAAAKMLYARSRIARRKRLRNRQRDELEVLELGAKYLKRVTGDTIDLKWVDCKFDLDAFGQSLSNRRGKSSESGSNQSQRRDTLASVLGSRSHVQVCR